MKPADQLETIPYWQADPADWLETNFYIPELSGPIRLVPYQKAVLREAHRQDAAGRFVYNLVIWSDIKKSAKSSIAAAVALYRGFANEWGSVKIVANDLKQADSRVAYYLRRAVTLNPAMKSTVKQINYKTTLPNHTIIEAVPVDPGGEAGGNDDLIIFSELWAARNKAVQQMWTEMTLSPNKFGYSQRWVETYAGYTGESPLLEQLYEQGIRGQRLDLSFADEAGYHDLTDLEIYAAGGMLCFWNTRPRCPWQTEEYYASEAVTILPDEFQRIHRNQWVSSTAKFVPDEWWEVCAGTLPAFSQNEPMILALDAGISDDCFGIVGVSRNYVRYSQKWTPPVNGKIDFQGTVDEPGPEREVERLCKTYNIKEVRYDPHQLHDMATRLANKLRVPFVEFSQGEDRLRSDKQLYDKIRDKRIIHNGDPDLTEHISNANAKKENEKLRIVKRTEKLKIDLAVALSMAAYEDPGEKKTVPGILMHGSAKMKLPR